MNPCTESASWRAASTRISPRVARELIAQGWDYVMLRRYKEGHISLGKLAEELGKPVGETVDLLAGLGVPAPIDYDDYLEGFETLASMGGKNR